MAYTKTKAINEVLIMFCKRCGTEIKDDSNFCPMCGANLGNETVADLTGLDSSEINEYSTRKFGMVWFKFLIYFGLWAGGISNILSGILYAAGHFSNNAETDELLFDYFPELKPAVIASGIFIIILGLFIIFTRFALAQYRKFAPMCLYIVYGANLVFNIVFATIVTAITGINAFDVPTITQLIIAAAMLIINLFYFKKRKDLFVR